MPVQKSLETYWIHHVQIFCGPLLHSAFTRLVSGHLQAPNHLNFYSLLYFCESHQGHFKALNHLRFSSLFYFCKSHQLRLFSTSQPCTVECKTSGQNDVAFSNSSTGLLCSLGLSLSTGVEIFSGLYNFLNAHAILVVTPPTYTLHVDMPPI